MSVVAVNTGHMPVEDRHHALPCFIGDDQTQPHDNQQNGDSGLEKGKVWLRLPFSLRSRRCGCLRFGIGQHDERAYGSAAHPGDDVPPHTSSIPPPPTKGAASFLTANIAVRGDFLSGPFDVRILTGPVSVVPDLHPAGVGEPVAAEPYGRRAFLRRGGKGGERVARARGGDKRTPSRKSERQHEMRTGTPSILRLRVLFCW